MSAKGFKGFFFFFVFFFWGGGEEDLLFGEIKHVERNHIKQIETEN